MLSYVTCVGFGVSGTLRYQNIDLPRADADEECFGPLKFFKRGVKDPKSTHQTMAPTLDIDL